MQFPVILFGRHDAVVRKTKKALRAVAAGARWTEAFARDGMVDAGASDAAILLDGPSRLVPDEHFRLYVAPRATQDTLNAARIAREREDAGSAALPATAWEHEDAVFAEMLTTGWGTLAVLAYNHSLLAPPARYAQPTARERPLLDSLVRHWHEYEALGARFVGHAPARERLAELPTTAQTVLLRLGIPRERLVHRTLDDFLELAAEVGVTPQRT
jgi:hypothetical protein